MPYVKRDLSGRIVALAAEPAPGGDELLPITHPDVTAFLYGGSPAPAPQRAALSDSDSGMARVIEDLIDVLVDHGVLMFTDLPAPAQAKLLERRRLRQAGENPPAPLMAQEDEVI